MLNLTHMWRLAAFHDKNSAKSCNWVKYTKINFFATLQSAFCMTSHVEYLITSFRQYQYMRMMIVGS